MVDYITLYKWKKIILIALNAHCTYRLIVRHSHTHAHTRICVKTTMYFEEGSNLFGPNASKTSW